MDNQYRCEMIQDLLALYHDGVCSEETSKVVEEHLSRCEVCRNLEKQLDNSEMEDKISQQAQDVLKKHGKKQRKKLWIVVIGAVVVLLAVIIFWVIKPRIDINRAIKATLPDVGEGAEYFTEYQLTDNHLVKKEHYGYAVSVPSDYIKQDVAIDVQLYQDAEIPDLKMIIRPFEDLSEMSLYHRDNYEDLTNREYKRTISTYRKWFATLGYGQPDTAYGMFKCMYLLDNDDRSFWNLEQNLAFSVLGVVKQEVAMDMDEIYIYEKGDVCGLVFVNHPNANRPYYYVVADLFSTDDLNMACGLILTTKTVEEAYAMINSVSFQK